MVLLIGLNSGEVIYKKLFIIYDLQDRSKTLHKTFEIIFKDVKINIIGSRIPFEKEVIERNSSVLLICGLTILLLFHTCHEK